jgi:hypothetical protein
MTINPPESKRTVVLEIQTVHGDQPQPDHSKSASAGIIIAIGVIVDDGTRVTENSFCNAAEIDLLREFWLAVQPHDVFVGHGITNQLAFLRRRSWELGLIPSQEIDLNNVYQHETLDPASLRAITGENEYGSAEALLSLFGLPGKIPAMNNRRVPDDYMHPV